MLKELSPGIVGAFIIDCITLCFIRMVINSIFDANMGQNRKAINAKRQYNFLQRMMQDYIKQYLKRYVKDYKCYMIVKRLFIVWIFLSPLFMLLLRYFLPVDSTFLNNTRLEISFGTLILFVLTHFNSSHRTRYDR